MSIAEGNIWINCKEGRVRLHTNEVDQFYVAVPPTTGHEASATLNRAELGSLHDALGLLLGRLSG